MSKQIKLVNFNVFIKRDYFTRRKVVVSRGYEEALGSYKTYLCHDTLSECLNAKKVIYLVLCGFLQKNFFSGFRKFLNLIMTKL